MGTIDGRKIGLVPQNYIKMVGRRSGKQDTQAQPNPAQKDALPKSQQQQMPRNQSMTTAEPTSSAIPNEFKDFEFPVESPESDGVTNNNHISSSSANVNGTLATTSTKS